MLTVSDLVPDAACEPDVLVFLSESFFAEFDTAGLLTCGGSSLYRLTDVRTDVLLI